MVDSRFVLSPAGAILDGLDAPRTQAVALLNSTNARLSEYVPTLRNGLESGTNRVGKIGVVELRLAVSWNQCRKLSSVLSIPP